MKRLISSMLVLAFTGIASTAHAALVVYTTQASFLAAVTSPGVDNFNGFRITGPTASPINRTAGSYGYTASAANNFYGAGTTADPWLSTNTATDPILFNGFTGGVSAVGGNFFDSDINGQFRSGNITLVAYDGFDSVTRTITTATTGSFLGFVSTHAFQSLSVTAVQPATPIWPTVDNLTLAKSRSTSIPEPTTIALLGLGLLGFAASRRKSTK